MADEYVTLAPEALAPGRLMRSLGLLPRKGLGQNFLVSRAALHHILLALAIAPDDTVIEIGAGPGTLTGFLAANAGVVLAVELDEHLAAYLRDRFAGVPCVRVLQADILALAPGDLLPEGCERYKVVGNLPYYITSAAIRHVLEWRPAPEVLVVMVQEEVARRIVAAPGDMSLLALMVQLAGQAEVVARVPPGAFVPAPKVSSAIVRITPHDAPADAALESRLFRLARAGFQQKRKTLVNSLSSGLSLPKDDVRTTLVRLGIPETVRPEELSVQQWLALAHDLE